MQDLISRQAAIEALGEKPLAWTEGEYELGLQNQWQSDVDALNGLPPAQPEIIRCKDCKYYRWEINMCDEPFSTAHNVVHEYDYCSKAERKTDG